METREVFEQLITTLTDNVVDGEISISNVPLFLKSWRAEFKIAEEQDNETLIEQLELIQGEFDQDEYTLEMRIESVNHIINEWIKKIKGETSDPNQTNLLSTQPLSTNLGGEKI